MGCDIHLYVERKRNGEWESVEKWSKEDDEDVARVDYTDCYYTGRNYDLFAILADVRNGSGFAGVDTGDGFNPIDAPRGLPDDACEQIKALSESWGVDGHSHSHFTLAELIAFDWMQTTKCRGYIDAPTFEEFDRWRRDRGMMPEEWCGGVGGGRTKIITQEEMRAKIKDIFDFERAKNPENAWQAGQVAMERVKTELAHHYCKFEQRQTYAQCTANFWSETMPRLFTLAHKGQVPLTDVRIVFWFDN